MKKIAVLGAGRSSSSLISYLLSMSQSLDLEITVGDFNVAAAEAKVNRHPRGKAVRFDIHQPEISVETIKSSDIVISLLPAHFHPLVGAQCLEFGKHLLTASYVSDEMKSFDNDARSKNLLFLNECGLDPGIDHMSAMQVLDRIRQDGGEITSFESFTGGLIAPSTDPDNPWRYKFTWNPRNVVMAGQATARFLQNSKYKYVPYQQLFRRITPVHVPGHGDYEGYVNRDSLKYLETYGLTKVSTMIRGTLRNKGFCSAWDLLVQLGCCDDTFEMENVADMTHASFIDSFIDAGGAGSIEQKIAQRFRLAKDSNELKLLRWSGFFNDEPVGLTKGTPAQVLEHILDKKWRLNPEDKDQIVMWHRFRFLQDGREQEIQAYLIATGTDSVNTAMAKTVGLPLGMAAKLLIQSKIQSRGVAIPTSAEFYNPILAELRVYDIELKEEHR